MVPGRQVPPMPDSQRRRTRIVVWQAAPTWRARRACTSPSSHPSTRPAITPTLRSCTAPRRATSGSGRWLRPLPSRARIRVGWCRPTTLRCCGACTCWTRPPSAASFPRPSTRSWRRRCSPGTSTSATRCWRGLAACCRPLRTRSRRDIDAGPSALGRCGWTPTARTTSPRRRHAPSTGCFGACRGRAATPSSARLSWKACAARRPSRDGRCRSRRA
mmetsp:Transcript_17199/g.60428  ORF Transcript_17199/g.60428 Transcript_17199/m.60428 type:complete len:217 (-) Transcript_17199:707-1357(-)